MFFLWQEPGQAKATRVVSDVMELCPSGFAVFNFIDALLALVVQLQKAAADSLRHSLVH